MNCEYHPKSKALIVVNKKWSTNHTRVKTFELDIVEHQPKQVVWKTKQQMSMAQILDMEEQENR
jgi:hypothetical protein